ncbi:unnamed protein product [Allacma fusca]|uniref:Uncharacterized protein n=1 Tax=Allacma fusca TaxID=39272 RepID=A0A8J2J5F2_9HEXA|nr:unnamed protein product [Allacma fusca]
MHGTKVKRCFLRAFAYFLTNAEMSAEFYKQTWLIGMQVQGIEDENKVPDARIKNTPGATTAIIIALAPSSMILLWNLRQS